MKKQGQGDRERQREIRGGKQQATGSRGRKCKRGAWSQTGLPDGEVEKTTFRSDRLQGREGRI